MTPTSRPLVADGHGRRDDDVSAAWLAGLGADGARGEDAVADLHALLLRAARAEASRRAGTHRLTGPELDDLAHQAADDAVVSVLQALGDFRGESRFTTWAYKFAVLEVARKVTRHAWRRGEVQLEEGHWERLPARLGADPHEVSQARELTDVVRRAVTEELTAHQRRVFVALVVDGVPMDVLAGELGSTRNAIYKTMFDARRRLRAHLASQGYLGERTGRGKR